MDSIFKDKRISDIRNIWQSLLWHKRECNLSTLRISRATGYRIDHIERGLAGEDIPVTFDFIRRLVSYLGLVSVRPVRPARPERYEDTYDRLTYDQYVELLKPPEEPPQQCSLWDK
ncbi:hypothetical protein ES703_103163 [subsurface metagenome]